jgi:hypothetical protein
MHELAQIHNHYETILLLKLIAGGIGGLLVGLFWVFVYLIECQWQEMLEYADPVNLTLDFRSTQPKRLMAPPERKLLPAPPTPNG